jgi:hypothetical protein
VIRKTGLREEATTELKQEVKAEVKAEMTAKKRQKAESKERRVKCREQRVESSEQRVESSNQRAPSRKHRAEENGIRMSTYSRERVELHGSPRAHVTFGNIARAYECCVFIYIMNVSHAKNIMLEVLQECYKYVTACTV